MTIWNMVDALSKPSEPRKFYPPLADQSVDKNLFEITEEYTNAADLTVTQDIALHIRIKPPAGGFPNAAPAIRLHALGKAEVTFYPGGQSVAGIGELKRDSLVLRFPSWPQMFRAVPWWQNWLWAQCTPEVLIYENVDRAEMRTLLQNAPLTNQFFPIFPPDVTENNRSSFINHFMQGARSVAAATGDYLGQVAPEADGVVDPNAVRLLSLHARYQGHLAPAAQPMNPRELFHLLFGNDSQEAQNHPLLRRLDELGHQQSDHPESKRMLLRPPLRTWKRVAWEAQLEIDNHAANWRPAGSLQTTNPLINRLFNSHQRAGQNFGRAAYTGSYKCNLFAADICLRAGFRVPIHDTGTRWHYMDANSYANALHQANGATDRVNVPGRNEDANVGWSWKVENWLRSQPASTNLRTLLNDAITRQGRCFIVTGARAQKFAPHTLANGGKGIASCRNVVNNGALRNRGIGHIIIVKELLAEPQFAQTAGQGLDRIRVQTLEASGSGATSRDFDAQRGGAAGNAASNAGFIRLHLFELQPGRDPDTLQGLRNLNVRHSNQNLLRTPDERAAGTPLTHFPNGTVRNDNQCCRDDQTPLVPNRDGSQITCP